MIRVERIVKVSQTLPEAPEGYLNFNCLNWYPNNVQYDIPIYQVAPYYLKDREGHIFENIWQGSKCYPIVYAQHEVKAGKLIWSHPEERHIVNGQLTKEFWAWRKKLWENEYPVRYPNGFHGRHECVCALWKEGNEWLQLNYLTARKKIYCKVYEQLVKETEGYKQLKKLYDAGQNIQICEMDVRPGIITEEVLVREINNDKEPFGHGYCLATCLMGLTHIFDT